MDLLDYRLYYHQILISADCLHQYVIIRHQFFLYFRQCVILRLNSKNLFFLLQRHFSDSGNGCHDF